MDKKYYLSVEQRECIVNALLQSACTAENELERAKAEKLHGPKVLDMVEASAQRERHLAELFKVEEHEKC